MLRRILPFLLLLFALTLTLSAQRQKSYKAMWTAVENEIKRFDRPKTAVSLVNEIILKAKAENNQGQLLKACVTRINLRDQIAPDSFNVDVDAFRRLAETTASPLTRAVVLSILAHDGFGSQAEQAETDALQSIRDIELLGSTKVDAYEPVINSKGNLNRYFGNDM
ncbi:MAG: hypothetical protein IIT64_06300, partial [Bacteroidaceae bacterium]|nr:hypothetical protein [Bacteroidaceae bacterium]